MFSNLARGAIMILLAVMIVSWAMSVGKTSPSDTQQPQLPTDRMYS